MAEPTEPQTPAGPYATPEPVTAEPVSASTHLGAEPDVPAVAEADEAEVVDDVAEPVLVEDVVVEPEPLVEPNRYAEPLVSPEPAVLEQEAVVEEYAAVEPGAVAPEPAPVAPAAVPVAEAPREVVYVQAPTPPKERGNRGFGVLISILGAIAFGLLYLAAAVVISLVPGTGFTASIPVFLASDAFWVPIAAYAVFSVIFALIVNRAAWWAHVISSIFVALLTYGASIGVLALLRGVVGMTAEVGLQLIGAMATSALLLAVLVVARETNLWFGLAISTRGRRVKERNAVARAEFERSVAEQRAEYERAHAPA